MNSLKTIAAAGLIAASLSVAPLSAQAQTGSAGSGFDGYRAAAVTAGVIAGAAVAAIVTDGLIIPVLAYATGTPAAMGGGGMGLGVAEGAMAAGGMGGAWSPAQAGYKFIRGGMRLFGAIGGGFYADSWYTGR